MPRGDKSKYTDKQKRKAEHIEESYEERGVPEDEAERRAWATVNKESGGGNKSGSGRGVPDTRRVRTQRWEIGRSSFRKTTCGGTFCFSKERCGDSETAPEFIEPAR